MNIKHSLNTNIFEAQTVVVANPGAGNQFSYTVPANMRILVVSVFFRLSASVAVANRVIRIAFNDGTQPIIEVSNVSALAASETGEMCFYIGAGQSTTSFYSLDKITSLPDHYWLNPGSIVGSFIRSLDAGDIISNIRIRHLTQIVE